MKSLQSICPVYFSSTNLGVTYLVVVTIVVLEASFIPMKPYMWLSSFSK